MAYVIEAGLETTKIFIFFTLLSACWGQLGGVQDPQYHYAVSFRYEETSNPDIKMKNGTKIDPCRSQRIYPCFTYDPEAKIVDLRSEHCEDLMQFTIFGTPVEQLINASQEQICCGYSLAGNLTKNVSCPDTMNDTRLYFDDHDCFSIHLSYILAIAFSYIGYNGIIFFLFIVIIYLCKNRSPAKERDATVLECGTYQQLRRRACCTALTELFRKFCFCTIPNQPWKCQCEKLCLLSKPILFNIDGKSYVAFVIGNEAEMFTCIDPHLEEYQQYFNVAKVFVVYMDDVDAATSADHLQVWYKESREWKHSLLKGKVFLSTPVSQSSPSGNSTSRFMGNGKPIQELTRIPEVQNRVLMDAPVQMNLVVPQSRENKDRGTPVLGNTHKRTRSLVGFASVNRMGAGGITPETVKERKESKVRSASYNALTTLDPDLRDEDEEPSFTPMRAST